ncbi:hypothetical protein IQ250_26815 [Pseudanabaenaceae cyanobacterium LEGE 13415]|nr:hypothetical protein [Pseudanabaenaceae cyanobacterium LEGE 13415]
MNRSTVYTQGLNGFDWVDFCVLNSLGLWLENSKGRSTIRALCIHGRDFPLKRFEIGDEVTYDRFWKVLRSVLLAAS